jgi:hypothetical protein
MKAFRNLILPMTAAVLALAPFAAAQVTLQVNYFTIAENDQDMQNVINGAVSNEVQNTLGPHGLPILNTAQYGCVSNCVADFAPYPLPRDLSSSGEITWWSPALNNGGAGGTSDVVQTSVTQVTLPFSNRFFYPPNGAGVSDLNGFQSATFSGTLSVPASEPVSFSLGADDVAFVYVDGVLACNLGGARGYVLGTCTTNTLTAGSHTLQIFYSDLFPTNAGFTFAVSTAGVTGTPGITAPVAPIGTPAPPTILLAMVALACLGLFLGYRRFGPRRNA